MIPLGARHKAVNTFWDGVDLYLPLEGADDSTTFTDLSPSPKTITRGGGTVIKTAQSVWGNGSCYFDGTDDTLICGSANEFPLGAGGFLVDFWFYPTTAARMALFAYDADFSCGLDFHYQGTRNINMWASSNGSSWDMLNGDPGGNGIGTVSLTLNAWNRIRFERIGNVFSSYVNDTLSKAATVSGTIYTTGRVLRFGTWGNNDFDLTGYLQSAMIRMA